MPEIRFEGSARKMAEQIGDYVAEHGPSAETPLLSAFSRFFNKAPGDGMYAQFDYNLSATVDDDRCDWNLDGRIFFENDSVLAENIRTLDAAWQDSGVTSSPA